MTSGSSSEQVIRRLYQITHDHNKGFEQQIIELLQMGLERFELDIGILSKIDQSNYVVKHCVTPTDVPMQPGDSFNFDSTYCHITCLAQGPVSIEHVGADDKYASHPAYKAFGLESYIGVPIRLNGELYGTLNFSSPTPYPRKFQDIDIDALQLMASWVESELVRREQEAQLRALNKKLKLLANYDSLTQIPNRRGMYKSLQKSMKQLSRKNGEGTLAMIDIDHFKQLNDRYGHQTGDEALVATAQMITDSLRDYDYLARFGGEEFLLWLPDTSQEGCTVVCQRIMNSIARITITPDPITVSIGTCHIRFSDERPGDISKLIYDLIEKADNALFEAKDLGRNRVVHYRAPVTES
ncbi:sensor domain-containing diguanylate cyclase [Aestuariirhabdus sp. Z084]|uniref:sensor domain-containing diguanylate cyclase n=1 Tax=Aestuariirhabdus haliotis TaxID=2918751 RepID=UPI00201B42BE|nr:diguanylate cyclase [Aestuariirhabdus haliotis]MCL6416802.1 sensor domain-containing diguanylate cyclase [Aestuariirhabdus haliotis]MCL6420802.1 sensor domain-containing diguanylate cyclase [Aestuariirhabdus haliotis]